MRYNALCTQTINLLLPTKSIHPREIEKLEEHAGKFRRPVTEWEHGSEARFGRGETRPCKCGGITQPIKNPPENHENEACFGRGETRPCKCGGTTQEIKNPPENS